MREILDDISMQLPGGPGSVIQPEILAQVDAKLLASMSARNAFSSALGDAKKTRIISEPLINTLMTLAEKVQALGYLNPYFELAEFFLARNLRKEAFETYEKVPKESIYFTRANAILAEEFFAKALINQNDEEKKCDYFKKCFDAAKNTSFEDRVEFIQRLTIFASQKLTYIDIGIEDLEKPHFQSGEAYLRSLQECDMEGSEVEKSDDSVENLLNPTPPVLFAKMIVTVSPVVKAEKGYSDVLPRINR